MRLTITNSELFSRLMNLCKEEGKSPQMFIIELLEEYLNEEGRG